MTQAQNQTQNKCSACGTQSPEHRVNTGEKDSIPICRECLFQYEDLRRKYSQSEAFKILLSEGDSDV